MSVFSVDVEVGEEIVAGDEVTIRRSDGRLYRKRPGEPRYGMARHAMHPMDRVLLPLVQTEDVRIVFNDQEVQW